MYQHGQHGINMDTHYIGISVLHNTDEGQLDIILRLVTQGHPRSLTDLKPVRLCSRVI